MKTIKIIFLDVDGVLNSSASFCYWLREQERYNLRTKKQLRDPDMWSPGFRAVDRPDPIVMSNLLMILEKCKNVRIVISSTWRIQHLAEVEKHFEQAGISWSKYVIGATPALRHLERYDEIDAWLEANTKSPEGSVLMPKFQVSDFMVIDDMSHMGKWTKDHFVRTDATIGLSWRQAVAIKERFLYGKGRPSHLEGAPGLHPPGPPEFDDCD